MAIKVGDTVQLKSGGPLMTVNNIGAGEGPHDIISCVWFEKTERKEGQFEAPTLTTKTIGGLHSRPRTRR
jgi:uncharacterized protein YodC (DUF2158 family)